MLRVEYFLAITSSDTFIYLISSSVNWRIWGKSLRPLWCSFILHILVKTWLRWACLGLRGAPSHPVYLTRQWISLIIRLPSLFEPSRFTWLSLQTSLSSACSQVLSMFCEKRVLFYYWGRTRSEVPSRSPHCSQASLSQQPVLFIVSWMFTPVTVPANFILLFCSKIKLSTQRCLCSFVFQRVFFHSS